MENVVQCPYCGYTVADRQFSVCPNCGKYLETSSSASSGSSSQPSSYPPVSGAGMGEMPQGPYPTYPTSSDYPGYGAPPTSPPSYGQPGSPSQGLPPGYGQPGAPSQGQPGYPYGYPPSYGQYGQYGQPGAPSQGLPPGYGQPGSPSQGLPPGYGQPGAPSQGLPGYPYGYPPGYAQPGPVPSVKKKSNPVALAVGIILAVVVVAGLLTAGLLALSHSQGSTAGNQGINGATPTVAASATATTNSNVVFSDPLTSNTNGWSNDQHCFFRSD